MAKVPKDIQDGLKKLADKTGTPIQSLIERLKEIKESDEQIQAMDKDDFKIRFAWALLYKENAATGGTDDFYVMPLIHPTPREITTKKGEKMFIGELAGLVQKLEKEGEEITPGEVQYAAGTFFRDGAEHLQKLEKGKVYKASLIAKENSWGLEISSDRASFVPMKDYKFPTTFKDFFEKEINPKDINISLGEIDLNKSETPTDIRVLTVTAFDCDVGESPDGREYGWYDFMDDSIMGSNYRLFFHPKDVEWSQGSILKVGVKIDINPKTDEPMLNPQFILPTEIAEKRSFSIKPVKEKQDTIDISEEPEPEEQTKEEPKKEEAKEEKPKQEPAKDEEEVDFEV